MVFKDKVTLITGGARGIGKATALKFAHQGSDIAIVYYSSAEEAEALVHEIKALGRKAIAIKADVADPLSVKELFAEFRQHFDHLDFLISNAASGVLKSTLQMKLKHWEWCMNTNAFALNALVTEAYQMMPQGSSVVALSSLGAQRAIPNYGFIGASKAALEALSRSLSLDLAPYGIRVNVVSAGVVDTDALKYFPNRQQLLDEAQSRSLANRPLTTKDVADAIWLLCLPEASMINGHTLVVDAGYSQIA